MWQSVNQALKSLKDFHFNGLFTVQELYFMTLKSDEKFGEELICCFKIDMTNLTRALESLKNVLFRGSF